MSRGSAKRKIEAYDEFAGVVDERALYIGCGVVDLWRTPRVNNSDPLKEYKIEERFITIAPGYNDYFRNEGSKSERWFIIAGDAEVISSTREHIYFKKLTGFRIGSKDGVRIVNCGTVDLEIVRYENVEIVATTNVKTEEEFENEDFEAMFGLNEISGYLNDRNDSDKAGEELPQNGVAVPDVVSLNELNDLEFVEYALSRAASSPVVASGLAYGLSGRFQQSAMPTISPAPVLSLPTVAPRLWSDRDAGTTPVEFIRAIYAPWIDAGVMTRSTLRDCDKALYNAYAQWIYRKPEDAIAFAGGNKQGPRPEPDAEKAITRVREGWRSAKQRARAKNTFPTASGPS